MMRLTIRKPHQSKQTPKQNKPVPAAQDVELTFMEHIYEVRGRLMWIILSLSIFAMVAYQFRDILIKVVMAPLHGGKLIYLNPGGGFTFIFTICLYVGALFTIPVVIFHLYKFLQPVIGHKSRMLILGIVISSIGLACLGIVFGYVLVIPGAIHFLGEFAGNNVLPTLTTDAYLNFTVMHLFGMALLFQLPLLLFISDHVRPFPPGTLLKLQRWVIAGSVIAAAVITPTPDPINLMLVALPIIAVYQLGVIIVWVRRRSYHATYNAKNVEDTPIVTESGSDEKQTKQGVAARTEPPLLTTAKVQSSVPTLVHKPVTNHRSVDGFNRAQRTQLVAPTRQTSASLRSAPSRSDTVVTTKRVSLDGLSMI